MTLDTESFLRRMLKMTSNIKYPFEQVNIFSIALSFSRKQSIPDQIEMPISIQVKVVEPGFPRIQVNMIVKSPPDTALSFSAEVVGLFDYVGEKTEFDKELNQEFIQEKALHLIWVYIDQLARLITGQMGMNPLKLKAPIAFEPQLTVQEN